MKKQIFTALLIPFVLVLLLSISAAAYGKYTFTYKNQMINVGGHEIVSVDATADKECIFTVDGKGYILNEDTDKETNEWKIYLKKALSIRTTEKESLLCEAYVDIKTPGTSKTPSSQLLSAASSDASAAKSSKSGASKADAAAAATASSTGSETSDADAGSANADASEEGADQGSKSAAPGFFQWLKDLFKSIFRFD